MYSAKIIADSICLGNRLTTMQITHPRIIHAEFMTHRMFCRNASSSRAIPFKKMLQSVQEDPFIPIYWGKNQSGMQAACELEYSDQQTAEYHWLRTRDHAIKHATLLSEMGLHKQICNRLLEPWGWITVCCTGDIGAWSNYFALRCHLDAQPEIRKQANLAKDVYQASKPEQLEPGDWHLPYVTSSEKSLSLMSLQPKRTAEKISEYLIKVSVGRCARTSYLTQEGMRDYQKDIELHDRLLNSKPMHASPFEHVNRCDPFRKKWYKGWVSYRSMLKGEYTTDYFAGKENLV